MAVAETKRQMHEQMEQKEAQVQQLLARVRQTEQEGNKFKYNICVM